MIGIQCVHCEKEVFSEHCPHCGQKIVLERLSLRNIWQDFVRSYLSFSARWVKTIWQNFKSVRVVALSYIRGDRKSYLNPIQTFVISSIIFISTFFLFSHGDLEFIDSILNFDIIRFHTLWEIEKFRWIFFNYFFVLFIPILSFMILLFYSKSGLSFTESMVVSIYLVSSVLWLSSVLIALSKIQPSMINITSIVIISYLTYGFMIWSGKVDLTSLLKGALVSILSYMVFIIIIFLISNAIKL